MRKLASIIAIVGLATSMANASASPGTGEGKYFDFSGVNSKSTKCCSPDKLKADLKEIDALVAEIKSQLEKSPKGTDGIRSKAIRLRSLADQFESQNDSEQLSAMREVFAKFNTSEYATYREMTGAASNDALGFGRIERLRNYCRNTDAKKFVEGKSNCLQGVDSVPTMKRLAPGSGGLQMLDRPRVPDSRPFVHPKSPSEFIYPKHNE